MKVLLKVVGLVVLVFVLFVCGVGLFGSGDYQVAKAITIDSSPEKIHTYVSDLKKWPEWAPWQRQDETVKIALGEKTEGVGASQTWTSESGDGELEITKSDTKAGIEYDMAFIMDEKKFPASSAMSYASKDGKTEVSWTMSGNYGDGFTEKIMAFAMPWMIGPSFDDGLEVLKTAVEGAK